MIKFEEVQDFTIINIHVGRFQNSVNDGIYCTHNQLICAFIYIVKYIYPMYLICNYIQRKNLIISKKYYGCAYIL